MCVIHPGHTVRLEIQIKLELFGKIPYIQALMGAATSQKKKTKKKTTTKKNKQTIKQNKQTEEAKKNKHIQSRTQLTDNTRYMM